MTPNDMLTIAMTSLTAVRDLTKLTFDSKVDAEVRKAVFEVLEKATQGQNAMYELREELFRLQGDNDRMKREAEDTAALENKLADFTLAQTLGGAVVYCHYEKAGLHVCPVCVNNKKFVPLQGGDNSGVYRCPDCKADYPIDPSKPMWAPPIDYGPRRGGY